MRGALTPLLQLQRFFLPALVLLVAWAVWRLVAKRDLGVGLALYLGLVVVVDGFYNTGIFLPGLARGSIRYSEICALFLIFARPAPAPSQGTQRGRVLWLVGAYFALLFLSALRSDPPLSGIMQFRALIIPQIVALVVAMRGLGSPEAYRRFFLALTAVVLLLGLVTFWDVFFDISLLKGEGLYSPAYWMNRRQGRFGSLFLNPNYLGAFVVLVFPAAFVSAMGERRARTRLYSWAGLLALVFSLVETQSRGPLLAFGLTVVALVLMPGGGVSRKHRLGYLAIFALVLSLFMPGFFRHSVQRFTSVEKEAAMDEVSRKSVWIYTRRIIADHPLLGIGFGEGQFLRAMRDYGFNEEYRSASLDNPHNSYLQAAVYAGVPAVAVFLLANGLLLGSALQVSLGAGEEAVRNAIFGLALGVVGFLVVIYPDMHLFTLTVAPVYWVFFGLLLAQTTGMRREAVA